MARAGVGMCEEGLYFLDFSLFRFFLSRKRNENLSGKTKNIKDSLVADLLSYLSQKLKNNSLQIHSSHLACTPNINRHEQGLLDVIVLK